MQKGLDGRRVALYVGSLENAAGRDIQQALEQAGARVHILADDADDDRFHGGVYAALVAVPLEAGVEPDARAVQLMREFLASDKPVAALGDAVELIIRAGGAAGRRIAGDRKRAPELEGAGAEVGAGPVEIDEGLITAPPTTPAGEFARAVVRVFSERLEEHAVDEMSELSFPASDPPAVSPAKLGGTSTSRPEEGGRA